MHTWRGGFGEARVRRTLWKGAGLNRGTREQDSEVKGTRARRNIVKKARLNTGVSEQDS